MPKKGPPDSDEAAPVAPKSFNSPKASEATLQALLAALQAPQPQEAAPRPMSPVQGIAGAILGALDPEAYERLVRPALQERKTEARRDYETAREQRGENIENLAAVHDLTRQGEVDTENARLKQQAYELDKTEFDREMDLQEEEAESLGNILQSKVISWPGQKEHAEATAQELMQADISTPEGASLREYGRLLSYAIVGQAAMLDDINTKLSTTEPGKISPDTFERWIEALDDLPKMLSEAAAKKAMFAHARLQAAGRGAERITKVPATRLESLAENKTAARNARTALLKFRELGKPSGPESMFGAITPAMREWRSYKNKATAVIKRSISGANIPEGEKVSLLGYAEIPDDALPDTVENALNRIYEAMQEGYLDKVSEYSEGGYFTENLRWNIPPIQEAGDEDDILLTLPPGAKPVGVTIPN